MKKHGIAEMRCRRTRDIVWKKCDADVSETWHGRNGMREQRHSTEYRKQRKAAAWNVAGGSI